MHTHIALLRGINVGGSNSLPMRELTAHITALGGEDVETYLQSGNVVFQSRRKLSARFGQSLADRIEQSHGFRPEILLLTADALALAIADNPFPEAAAAPRSLHLFFLADAPVNADRGGLDRLRIPSERYVIVNRQLYLHAPDGIGRSRLAASAERLLRVTATARNWRTVLTLAELAQGSG